MLLFSWRCSILLESRSREDPQELFCAEGSNLLRSHGASAIKCAKDYGRMASLGERKMTHEDRKLCRTAKEAEFKSWLDHNVCDVVITRVADKD